jgi:hypothetical protein
MKVSGTRTEVIGVDVSPGDCLKALEAAWLKQQGLVIRRVGPSGGKGKVTTIEPDPRDARTDSATDEEYDVVEAMQTLRQAFGIME